MSDPLASLNLLLQRASAERDNALVALRGAESALQSVRHQADQLGQYRDEYRARWGERFREGGSAALVQCHHGFTQRLDQAIALQQGQLQQAQSRLDAARMQVLEREQRVAAVRKLIERRELDARRKADRREQRSTDEAAQRARHRLPQP
jgi:flagellar protein FliJ